MWLPPFPCIKARDRCVCIWIRIISVSESYLFQNRYQRGGAECPGEEVRVAWQDGIHPLQHLAAVQTRQMALLMLLLIFTITQHSFVFFKQPNQQITENVRRFYFMFLMGVIRVLSTWIVVDDKTTIDSTSWSSTTVHWVAGALHQCTWPLSWIHLDWERNSYTILRNNQSKSRGYSRFIITHTLEVSQWKKPSPLTFCTTIHPHSLRSVGEEVQNQASQTGDKLFIFIVLQLNFCVWAFFFSLQFCASQLQNIKTCCLSLEAVIDLKVSTHVNKVWLFLAFEQVVEC